MLTICFGGLLGAGMGSSDGKLRLVGGSKQGLPAGGQVSRGPTP